MPTAAKAGRAVRPLSGVSIWSILRAEVEILMSASCEFAKTQVLNNDEVSTSSWILRLSLSRLARARPEATLLVRPAYGRLARFAQ